MTDEALIIVDLQNDYFPGGRWPLVGIEDAAGNGRLVLSHFREKDMAVVHIRHEFPADNAPFFAPGSYGAQINELVLPKEGEPVVLKHHPNAFRDTNLKTLLDEREIRKLTILGAMSHVCIDATVRAAVDFGYDVTVVHDAVATRDLEFNGTNVPANQVHSAYMAALAFAYAKVMPTAEIVHTSE
ncbi:cysteine hydrolase [Gluconacetobacter entanii]|uniref:Cysteine hydrolase n=1 Tax=Gluconacetobacter entanii TaxID=108528 RepID=A0ABT3K127_9PROT|nr:MULTISPECIES: cysteine hydrolase family protein [Acetobacteraceae]ATU72271.1 cysteine hydrolase [Komagataeibacter xylinus]MBV1825541.1 cysteine hydrolase [Komagataeibacter oboediens]MCW4589100.1 cysteine hydrolase [Gluconacetobacter entanii]MCW4592570.1 cysteine hydrolase [Gluconacetobacter entanii]NPC89098.1 cysteine hydrolase [Gluconacetobacter entanii]